jgi:AraC-like DNA-binding protein
MLSSSGNNCTDVDEFRAAVRPVNNEIVLTGSGSFSASVIRIDLRRLWMQRIDETLARSWCVQMESPRVAIGFPVEPGCPTRHQGIELAPDEVGIFTPTHSVWHTTFGPSRFASMSLPLEDLVDNGVALAGDSIMRLGEATTAKVGRELMSRLRSLHAEAVQLAKHAPGAIEDPNRARGLEAALTGAMVGCLTNGHMRADTASQRRHAAIIKRLHALEEAARERPLYLAEVCSALGVSQRTLHQICHEMLGIGPKRYLCLRRLHLARRELRAASSGGTTVTDVATKFGFWELGRFAVAYRSLFGESPSATLRQEPIRH